MNSGLNVIPCIGEKLEERESGKTEEVVFRQLKAIADNITDWDRVVLAYEPVWAIGTKVTPTTQQITEVAELIKSRYQSILAKTMQLVYGGSVNSENCKDIINIKDVAGVLVGGASLNKEELFKILNS